MENRPPQQETPRRPPNPARKTNGSGGPPTPPWLWLIVIGLLALIFWHFVPKTEVEVPYYPWFKEQLDKGNVKSIAFESNQVRGELFQAENYSPPSGATVPVTRFYTFLPSEFMIPSVVDKVEKREGDRGTTKPAESPPATVPKKKDDGARITGSPPNQAGGLAWIMLLLPTVFVLGLIWLMMLGRGINSMAASSGAS